MLQRASQLEEDDKDNTLLSRLTSCRTKDPEQFKEIGLAMADKQKHARTTTQREMVITMLESMTSSLTVKRTRGGSSVDEGGIHHAPDVHEARHDGGEGDSNVEDRP